MHFLLKFCCVCLEQNDNLKIIDRTVFEKLLFCVEEANEIPSNITKHLCKFCLRKLNVSYNFKRMCLINLKQIQNSVSNVQSITNNNNVINGLLKERVEIETPVTSEENNDSEILNTKLECENKVHSDNGTEIKNTGYLDTVEILEEKIQFEEAKTNIKNEIITFSKENDLTNQIKLLKQDEEEKKMQLVLEKQECITIKNDIKEIQVPSLQFSIDSQICIKLERKNEKPNDTKNIQLHVNDNENKDTEMELIEKTVSENNDEYELDCVKFEQNTDEPKDWNNLKNWLKPEETEHLDENNMLQDIGGNWPVLGDTEEKQQLDNRQIDGIENWIKLERVEEKSYERLDINTSNWIELKRLDEHQIITNSIENVNDREEIESEMHLGSDENWIKVERVEENPIEEQEENITDVGSWIEMTKTQSNQSKDSDYWHELFEQDQQVSVETNNESDINSQKQQLFDNECEYSCTTCGKCFPLRKYLVRHMSLHTRVPHSCTECGKRFNRKDSLNRHMALHSNEQPFTCAQCGITFKRRELLRAHLVLHVNDNRTFACAECTKCFYTEKSLNIHMLTHSEPAYACTLCTKMFHRKSTLNRHLVQQHHNQITKKQ